MGKRDLNVDLIRVVAIIMVVAVHVSAPLAVQYGTIAPARWWAANIVESLTRPSVPLFIMVSGMLLLAPQKEESFGAFYRRRALRVLVPFLVWAVVYLVWRNLYHGEALTAADAVIEIISGPVYTHFWFIYVLLGLYLVTPILRVFVQHASPPMLWLFVALWFVGGSLVPLWQAVTGIGVGIGWTVTVGYSGYFVLGHTLRALRLNGRQRITAALGVAAMLVTTAVATAQMSSLEQGLSEMFYANLSPNVIVMSVLMFLLLRSVRWPVKQSGRATRALIATSGASFGIYLIHPLIQEVLHGGVVGVSLSGASFVPVAAIPVTVVVVVALSLGLVRLLSLAPGGRFVVT